MKYTVLWTPSAERQLTRLWLDATDRDAVRGAADRLDEILAERPSTLGESRHGEFRIALIPPLGFEYKVQEADRLVKVIAVWTFKKRPERRP
ncbi:MAG: hypothetical protein K8T25_04650 [Planctomycetia bacterium]|nr:hypothetical protein [Planctomycetia bacterium]